ncbi:hypothetical protein Droror1_Dr00027136, partial [Drosera rotundifolia]
MQPTAQKTPKPTRARPISTSSRMRNPNLTRELIVAAQFGVRGVRSTKSWCPGETQEFDSLPAMVERAAALEGAMCIAKAMGVRRGREDSAQIQSQGGQNKKKKFSNNKSGSSGTSYTQHPQCR